MKNPIVSDISWLWKWLMLASQPEGIPELHIGVVPTVAADRAWPKRVLPFSANYASIAGTVTTVVANPGEGNHSLVEFLGFESQTFAVGEIVLLQLDHGLPAGIFESHASYRFAGAVAMTIPLVGGVSSPQMGAVNTQFRGTGPIYVCGPAVLRVLHTSVAGGVNFQLRGSVRTAPNYQPLLPL
jgi:hypothetical protein